MKVKYIERTYLKDHKCIDVMKTRFFDKMWIISDLIYCKRGEFEVFTIEEPFVIEITE